MGPRDIENGTVELARRDTLTKEIVKREGLGDVLEDLLIQIQDNLFRKAELFRDDHITKVDNFDQFKEVLEQKGGFISAFWDESSETEEKIKELTKATIRCIPQDGNNEAGFCVFSGKPATKRVLFARAY
jgi:prolyl-tRNA synthetase